MKFLVRDLDRGVLKLMRKEARAERVPLAEHLRSILCAHFSLDCIPSRARPRESKGATTIVLRMQPELWQAVKDASESSGNSMQTIVREALEAPYREVAA